MPTDLDPRIDQLYQLPLQKFTIARNALAKELAGSSRRQVQSLAKPALPVWFVNQLHWRDRGTYKALIDAAEKFRDAHRALLNGRKADLRGAEHLHRSAIDRAFAKTLAIVQKEAPDASGAVTDQIRRVLSALPSDEPAGRLTKAPEPAGFALLAGVKPRVIKEGARGAGGAGGAGGAKADAAKEPTNEQLQRAARAKARELSEARAAFRRAQQKAESAAFASRRAATDVERARKAIEALEEKRRSADTQARETASLAKDAERHLKLLSNEQ